MNEWISCSHCGIPIGVKGEILGEHGKSMTDIKMRERIVTALESIASDLKEMNERERKRSFYGE